MRRGPLQPPAPKARQSPCRVPPSPPAPRSPTSLGLIHGLSTRSSHRSRLPAAKGSIAMRNLAQGIGAQWKQHHQTDDQINETSALLCSSIAETMKKLLPATDPIDFCSRPEAPGPAPSGLRLFWRCPSHSIPPPRALPPGRNSAVRASAALPRRRSVPHNPALADHNQLGGDLLHQREYVRGKNTVTPRRRNRLQQVAHDLRSHRIDGFERLVQKKHLRIRAAAPWRTKSSCACRANTRRRKCAGRVRDSSACSS